MGLRNFSQASGRDSGPCEIGAAAGGIIIPHMTRPRFLLPLFLTFATATAFADFHIESSSNRFAVDAAGNVPVHVAVINATMTVAEGVELYLFGTQTIGLQAPGWSCTPQPPGNKCTRPALTPGASAAVDFRIHFDQPYGRVAGAVGVRALLEGRFTSLSDPAWAVLYRRFMVTQTGDAGAGSLRAAVEALNADAVCAELPCSIEFDLPRSGEQTISLRSPLPQITANDVLIDGGDSMTVDGAAAGNANGFDFTGLRGEVTGLAVRNFSDNAILRRLRRRTMAFQPSFELVVTNCVLERNFRGISFGPGFLGPSLIRDCVIDRNVRSAVFDWSEQDPSFPTVGRIRLERNRIIGNGASGIFLGEGSDGAVIVDNVIESNHDFGVAVARHARHVRILANRIAHNGGAAIDVGLDGPAANLAKPGVERGAAIIDSAAYDPATNTTTVRGSPGVNPIPRSPCDYCFTHIVSLYANDAAEHGEYAEAQTYLGEAQPDGPGFVFTVVGDLRGKYVTALAISWADVIGSVFFDTEELSKAVLVQ